LIIKLGIQKKVNKAFLYGDFKICMKYIYGKYLVHYGKRSVSQYTVVLQNVFSSVTRENRGAFGICYGGWWVCMSKEDFFFRGYPNKRGLTKVASAVRKAPSTQAWKNLRIERFHGARLVSGSNEPKVVNACIKTRFLSPSFNFLSLSSKQLPHKLFIIPQLWIIEICVLHEKDAPQRGKSILTICFEFHLV
jgi:hypothetical protein